MAKKTGRPVRAVLTRSEDFVASSHRINYKNYNKIGVKKDGTITAMYSKIIANCGEAGGNYVPFGSALLNSCSMFYEWQNSKAETCGVLTNILGYSVKGPAFG